MFAGTLNLGAALTVRAVATGSTTLLAECVRLIEAAEARRSRFVVLADRVARRYAPAVHLAALVTFLWWFFIAGASAGEALLIACAVLIITCPCALALAVPVVQVIATSGLFRAGVLLKSATALERLADVDTIVFDKTGTLTAAEPGAGAGPGLRRAGTACCGVARGKQRPSPGPFPGGCRGSGRLPPRAWWSVQARGCARARFRWVAGTSAASTRPPNPLPKGRGGQDRGGCDTAPRPLAGGGWGAGSGTLARSTQPRTSPFQI